MVIFDQMPDILNVSLLGAGSFYIPLNIPELCSVSQLPENSLIFWVLLCYVLIQSKGDYPLLLGRDCIFGQGHPWHISGVLSLDSCLLLFTLNCRYLDHFFLLNSGCLAPPEFLFPVLCPGQSQGSKLEQSQGSSHLFSISQGSLFFMPDGQCL